MKPTMSTPPPDPHSPSPTPTPTTVTTTRPWSSFFSLSSLSPPVSLSDATTRLTTNLHHFKPNYATLALTTTFLSLSLHPLSLLLVLLVCLAWHFLFFARRSVDSQLEFFGFFVDDRLVAAVLGVVSVLVLVYVNLWRNLFVAGVVAAVLVCLHGVLMVPQDGDFQSPYGGLLDAEAGAYTQI